MLQIGKIDKLSFVVFGSWKDFYVGQNWKKGHQSSEAWKVKKKFRQFISDKFCKMFPLVSVGVLVCIVL